MSLPRTVGVVRLGYAETVSIAPLPSKPAAHVEFRRQFHAAEVASVNVRDPVVLGQPLIEEGVVAVQRSITLRSSCTTLPTNNSVSLRMAARRLSSQSGNSPGIGEHGLHAAQVQPLAGEIDHQLVGAGIRQHAA